MLFDLIFYTLLIGTSLLSYKSYQSTASNWFYKSLKGFLFLFCGLIWLWQILLWTLPKGSQLEEAIHLPRHLYFLEYVEIVKEVNNQKITYGKHARQYYTYYPAPKNSKNKATLIFYIHGGGWCLGSPAQHRFLGKMLQEQGYSLILPAYRLCPEVSYPEIQSDINDALLHSLDLLEREGIREPNIIIGGTSAGANLAALLAYDENRWEALGLDRNRLKGVFSIAGVLDIDQMGHSSTLLNYTGPPSEEQYKKANPMTWLNAQDSFQFLCLHGNADALAPYSNALSFCNKLETVHPELLDLRTFDNTSHIDLGASWYYNPNANYGQDTILVNWLEKVSL